MHTALIHISQWSEIWWVGRVLGWFGRQAVQWWSRGGCVRIQTPATCELPERARGSGSARWEWHIDGSWLIDIESLRDPPSLNSAVLYLDLSELRIKSGDKKACKHRCKFLYIESFFRNLMWGISCKIGISRPDSKPTRKKATSTASNELFH